MTLLLLLITLLCGVSLVPAPAVEADGDDLQEFMYEFLAGDYDLIGRLPNEGHLYQGTVSMETSDGGLQIKRLINGDLQVATGRLDSTIICDSQPVLRVSTVLNGDSVVVIYQIQSDPDNYPRLTGYVSLQTGNTSVPGLEALFPRLWGR